MRHTVTFQEKSKGFANQTFRLLLVGRSRSGFSSPDSDTYYTLGLAVKTITESSMAGLGGRTAALGQCCEVQSVFPALHCGLQQRVGTEDWESEVGGFLVLAGPGTLGHRGQPGIVWSGLWSRTGTLSCC